jgi:hypothetical protein
MGPLGVAPSEPGFAPELTGAAVVVLHNLAVTPAAALAGRRGLERRDRGRPHRLGSAGRLQP